MSVCSYWDNFKEMMVSLSEDNACIRAGDTRRDASFLLVTVAKSSPCCRPSQTVCHSASPSRCNASPQGVTGHPYDIYTEGTRGVAQKRVLISCETVQKGRGHKIIQFCGYNLWMTSNGTAGLHSFVSSWPQTDSMVST